VAMRPQNLPSLGIGPLPRDDGNTRSLTCGSLRSTSQAALESGRIDRPVFVPGRRAVRAATSISVHLSFSASPLRHPDNARNCMAA